jgi:hypothetical protein
LHSGNGSLRRRALLGPRDWQAGPRGPPHSARLRTLARIPDYKITKVDDLLPWRWNR